MKSRWLALACVGLRWKFFYLEKKVSGSIRRVSKKVSIDFEEILRECLAGLPDTDMVKASKAPTLSKL